MEEILKTETQELAEVLADEGMELPFDTISNFVKIWLFERVRSDAQSACFLITHSLSMNRLRYEKSIEKIDQFDKEVKEICEKIDCLLAQMDELGGKL